MKHKFFKNAKKTSALIPLIEKSRKEREDESSSESELNQEAAEQQNKDKFWSFGDTLKPEGEAHVTMLLIIAEQEIAKKQVQEQAVEEEKKESRRKKEHGKSSNSSSKSRRYLRESQHLNLHQRKK